MSGAISAGAYTAGVFDFLIQALDEWEAARGTDDVARHRANLKVMAGASAGAITAAIGAIALGSTETPHRFASAKAGEQEFEYWLPKLYETWVVRPTLVGEGHARDFLMTDDIVRGSTVTSLLNSKLLDDIAGHALKIPGPRQPPRKFVAEHLHVYMTLSNLRGVPYQIKFTGGDYSMMAHGDRAHYCIEGLGSWTTLSAFADSDATRPIDIAALAGAPEPPTSWQQYAQIAVASGAFPIGLAPRMIEADFPDFKSRQWPLDADVQRLPDPDWPTEFVAAHAKGFTFTTVDGGMINNDPFEFAHYSLRELPNLPNERDPNKADRAVIMIAPFADPKTLPPDGLPATGLTSIAAAIFPTLIDQARFKPDQLLLAANDKIASRYMISPHRVPPKLGGVEPPQETYALASGVLGGFGGFLARSFRDHDFQLGRRNCQRFLEATFKLPWGNELIARGYAADAAAKDKTDCPIIPSVGKAKDEVPYPVWPRLSEKQLDEVVARIKKRLGAVATNIAMRQLPHRALRVLLQPAWYFGEPLALKYIRLTILSDLIRRDQIEGWGLNEVFARSRPDFATAEEIRKVLAELANPAFDLRNIAGLARATHLPSTKIAEILDACAAVEARPFTVWKSPWTDSKGGQLFTLASRKPSWLAQQIGVQRAGIWFSHPRIDEAASDIIGHASP
jgi:Patatin-like phospholipase